MAKLEHVTNGISSFFENQIFSQMKSEFSIMGCDAVLTFVLNRIKSTAPQYMESNVAKVLGVVDSEGNINIPELVEATKETINKRGILTLTIPLVGKLTLDEDFFELLRQYIEEEASKQ